MTLAVSPAHPRSIVWTLARRSLDERRRFVASLSVAVAAFAVMVGALYSSVGSAYDQVVDELPAALEGMLGGADFGTPEGFVQVELFSFLAPGLAIAAGVSVAASALAGAEQSGRLALITTAPLRRSYVVSGALVAAFLAVVAVAAALLVGILGGSVLGGLAIDPIRVAEACLSLGLLGCACASIACAAGAATGSRGVALGVGGGVALASYVVDAFFPLSGALQPFAKLSLWYQYNHAQPLINGLDASNVSVLVLVTAGGAGIACSAFERRDLG